MRKWILAATLINFVSPTWAQDTSAVQKQIDTWEAAYNKADATTLLGLYAEDAQILPQGSETVKGRSAIQSYICEGFKEFSGIKRKVVDLKLLGTDSAREIGTYTIRTKGKKPQEFSGKYTMVWQKLGNDWKVDTEMWNSNE